MATTGPWATPVPVDRRSRPVLSRWAITSYALFWVAGAAILWWPWALAKAFLGRRRNVRPPTSLLLTCSLLAVSLTVAAVLRPNPLRVVSAVANLAIWFALLLWSIRRWTRAEVDGVLRGIVDLAVIQAVLALAAFAVYPALSGTILPLARLLPDNLLDEPNINFLSTIRLAQPDYFGRPVLRTAGLFGNATWAGGLAGLALVIVLFGGDRLSPRLRRMPVRLVLAALCAHSLYVAYARVDIVAVFAAAAGVWAVRKQRFFSPKVLLGSGCLVAATLIVLSPYVPLGEWFQRANELRKGSLETRSEIYGATLERVQNAPIPLIGAGIKERESGLVASVGSHSTYLGLAYRGGLLCPLSYAFFLLMLLWRSWRLHAPLAFGLVVYVLVWCVTDDIDAGNLIPLGLLAAFCLIQTSEPEAVEEGQPVAEPPVAALSPSGR
jgi:hypothetical protein